LIQEEEFDEEEYQRRVNGNDELDRHRETTESCQMEVVIGQSFKAGVSNSI
jgi:hypothetical protein